MRSNKILTKTNMKASALSRQSPFVYFWLGMLTGILLVIGSFMIRSMADEGATSIFRSGRAVQNMAPSAARSMEAPNMVNSQTNSINNPDMKVGINNPDMKVGKGY